MVKGKAHSLLRTALDNFGGGRGAQERDHGDANRKRG